MAEQWEALGYLERPDFGASVTEYRRFVRELEGSDVRVHFARPSEHCTMDALFPRDAAVITPAGAVLCRMGKRTRFAEPDALAPVLLRLKIPIVGRIQSPGILEGGDVIWLDERSVAVGIGYRTNEAGADQLATLLGDEFRVIRVALPHWNGPNDVLHLMSIISPLDTRLFVVYSRLMPVLFRQLLYRLGATLIDVDESEYKSLACNVLATSAGRCLMLSGNPETRVHLERAGMQVSSFEGEEICLKGQGGPTCMTLPVGWRHSED